MSCKLGYRLYFFIQFYVSTILQLTVWQFDWQFSFTIRLTIGLTILVDQNGWNYPSVRAATLPWSKAGVSCRCWRTLAESDARMGRVTRGKDSFWRHFTVDRFHIIDLSPGPNLARATLNRNCWCRWFYTYSRQFTHVYLRVRVYLRAMHFYSMDYFANFLRLKVLNFYS